MNNPFGISDELFDIALKMAIEQKKQTKSHTTENHFKVDPATMAKKSASMAKQLYDAYVDAGFTTEQAFELVKSILTKRN